MHRIRVGCVGRRLSITALVLGIGLGGASALPAEATAAPGWTAPAGFALPTSAPAFAVHIAYQSGGTATLAYLEIVSQSPLVTVLHVGVIPPGGSYQEQLRIASTSTSVPADVALAEAPNGAAVVEWAALQGTNPTTSPYTYLAAYRPAGSAVWQAPATIATDAVRETGIYEYLAPAVSADGTAAAGVDHVDPTIPSPYGYRVDAAVNAGGTWGQPAHISPPSDSSESAVLGFDAGGDLTAAYRLEMGSSGRYTLAVNRRPATSGIWGSLEDVTGSDPTSDAGIPRLGVAPDGSAVIAFQYVHHTANTADANAVTRAGENGSWTAPADVAGGGASSAPVAAGVSPDDTAYVLYWLQGTNSGLSCDGAVRAGVGGSFSAPHCVSPANFQNGYAGGLAFLGNDPYFAWSGQPNGGAGYVVEGSRWLAGAAQADSFTDLEAPSPAITFNTLVPDEDGSVAGFWTTSPSTLRVSAFDAGGPNLISASVPAAAQSGRAVVMSAGFADLWSGVPAPPSWSFGDGSGAAGAQVTHAYSAPGTYTVTVTATDGLGNPASATYRITVSAGSAAPRLTAVSQSAARWREPGKGNRRPRGRRLPIGTTFRFTLDQSATVTLAFSQTVPGRRASGRCERPTRRNRRGRACRLTVVVGHQTVAGHAGPNRHGFTGRLTRHRVLSPGAYTLILSATNSAHQQSARRTLRFTIVRG